MHKPAVFIKRDGILNEVSIDTINGRQVPPLSKGEFKVKKQEAFPFLHQLARGGFLIFAITHQPAVAKGDLRNSTLKAMHDVLLEELPKIKAVMTCPDERDDHCSCCPPQPGLLIEASKRYGLDLARSFVISDRWEDLEAGKSAGCRCIFVQSPWGQSETHPDCIVHGLYDGVAKILEMANCRP